jgi:hypothetical protein
MFGSVPLRTYLPDGDIDLSVFCPQEAAASMRDNWALKLQTAIEREQKSNPSTPFKVEDITVINAEVRQWVGAWSRHPQPRFAVHARMVMATSVSCRRRRLSTSLVGAASAVPQPRCSRPAAGTTHGDMWCCCWCARACRSSC